jgi:predicted small lipoprotein YifL
MLGALTAALVLSGCGRKGPLDPPPASLQQPDGQAASGAAAARSGAQPIEYGPDGRPLAPRGPKRKLPLDWLID